MKNPQATFLVLLTTLITPFPALAVFIQDQEGVVFDTLSGQYWYQDLSAWTNNSYSEVLTAIGTQLNGVESSFKSDSWGNWRMATLQDMENL